MTIRWPEDRTDPNGLEIFGRWLLLVGLTLWTPFIVVNSFSGEPPGGWFHSVDLIFHEAGHVVFGLFGRFPGLIGGSLMQLIVPSVIAGNFLWRGHPAGAGVGIWWFGESCADLAPYIGDARALRLPLLGGIQGHDAYGFHDWNTILDQFDALMWCYGLANFTLAIGGFSMVGGLVLLCRTNLNSQPTAGRH